MPKIIGNTTATPNPRADWAQTNSFKADYIKNKPNIFENTVTNTVTVGSDNLEVGKSFFAGINSNNEKYIKLGNTTATESELKQAINNQRQLTPDDFEGTDAEKLQACFDELGELGGMIIINRNLTITDDIHVSHNSNKNQIITIKGIGEIPRILMTSHCFYGDNGSTGGLMFEDLELVGAKKLVNGATLIRLWFNNCLIHDFENVIESERYVQTVYFTNCLIRQIQGYIIKTPKDKESDNLAAKIYDAKITGCLIEWGMSGILQCGSISGSTISNNCIEGTRSPNLFDIKYHSQALNITNNYLENNTGSLMDLSNASSSAQLNFNFSHNWLCETGATLPPIIVLPPACSNSSSITISGNVFPPSNDKRILIKGSEKTIKNLFIFNNQNAAVEDEYNNLYPWSAEDVNKALTKKTYELIDAFTITETKSTESRSTEPDGTPYNFEKVYIEAISPKTGTDADIAGVVKCNGNYAMVYYSTFASKSVDSYTIDATISAENGMIRADGARHSPKPSKDSTINSALAQTYADATGGLFADSITGVKIMLTGSSKFPFESVNDTELAIQYTKGTVVKIYGVRADSVKKPKLIYFTILEHSGYNRTCIAEEGMTWENWINSIYNIYGYEIKLDVADEAIFAPDSMNPVLDEEGTVIPTDVIDPSITYNF